MVSAFEKTNQLENSCKSILTQIMHVFFFLFFFYLTLGVSLLHIFWTGAHLVLFWGFKEVHT